MKKEEEARTIKRAVNGQTSSLKTSKVEVAVAVTVTGALGSLRFRPFLSFSRWFRSRPETGGCNFEDWWF
ncbi:hypothetical protein SLE2022_070070 [Rubroshorea leprosula]